MTLRGLIEAAERPAIRIPPTVVSFLETDLAELAADPAGHGLDADEAAAYGLVRDAVDLQRGVLAVGPGTDRAALARALSDLGNQADGIAVHLRKSGDRAGAQWHDRVAGALATLAGKVRHA